MRYQNTALVIIKQIQYKKSPVFWNKSNSIAALLLCLTWVGFSAHAGSTITHDIDFILERSFYSHLDGKKPHWIVSENNQTFLEGFDHQIRIGMEVLPAPWVEEKLFSRALKDESLREFFKLFLPSTLHIFIDQNPRVLFEYSEVHLTLWSTVLPSDRVMIFKKYFDLILHTQGHAREDKFKNLIQFLNQQEMTPEERDIYDSVLKRTSIDRIKPGILDCILDLTGKIFSN